MTNTTHTALYLRVSTEAQADEGYSLPAQKEKLEAYCRMKGISGFRHYVDGGFSGSNLSRPAITELVEDIRKGNVDRVVVYKLDRLSRSQKDTLYLIEDVFLPHNVDFVSINENIDTGSPYGRAMIGILSAFAQLERENIFMRTRMGMLERVKQGYWPGGGKPPFGYDYDRQKGILVPNDDAEIVKEIYARYLDGQSTGRIAKELGLKYEQFVKQILKRESNTGVIVYKGETYQGRHEPLVTKETFEKVRKRLHRRDRPRAAEAGKLLTGLLVCGHCGAKMRYQKWGNAGDKLVCYSRDKSKPHLVHDENCPNNGIMASDVEDIVIRDLSRLAAAPVKKLEKNTDEKACKRALDKANKKLVRLYGLFADADDGALLEAIQNAKREKERAKKLLDNAKASALANNGSEAAAALRSIGSCWDRLGKLDRQTLVRACVEKIVLKNSETEIYYSFETE